MNETWFTSYSFPGPRLGFEYRAKGYKYVAFFTINSVINSAKAELPKKNCENESHRKNLYIIDLYWPEIQSIISECIQIYHC